MFVVVNFDALAQASYISSVHGTAVSKMQQLWRINMATAKCVETTSESHLHFAKQSPVEMKTRPSIAQNLMTTWAPSQYPKRRLSVRSRKVSKA